MNKLIHIIFLISFIAIPFNNLKAEKNDLYVEADSLIYDKEKNTVTAKGKVLINEKNIFITADKIVYHKKTGVIQAFENVAMKDKDNFYFGNKLSLNINNYTGNIINFKARLSQKGLLAANSAEMINKDTVFLKELVFSTCKVCANNLISYIPIWQVRAKEAEIDRKNERITYKHGIIEAFGLPIFYTPYFSMPSPEAKKKSGLLFPRFKRSNIFGNQIQTPFYFNIAPNIDAVYSPIFSSKGSILHDLKFRHLTKYGLYSFHGYFTKAAKHNNSTNTKDKGESIFKGYIDFSGDFKLTENIDLALEMQRALNKDLNFPKEYNINKNDVLNTHAYGRFHNDKNLLMVDVLMFQDLRPNYDKKETPEAAPWFRSFSELPIKLPYDTKMFFSSDILNLHRAKGVSYQRGSFALDTITNMILPYGQIITLNPSLKWDLYHFENSDKIIKNNNKKLYNRLKTRSAYQLFLKWGLPIAKQVNDGRVVVEPLINLSINPKTSKNYIKSDIQEVILSSENIFSKGYYLDKENQETGTKITYGIRSNYAYKDGNYGLLVGQSYNFDKNKRIIITKSQPNQPTKITKKSNYIFKFYIQPNQNVVFVNNLSLSSKNPKLYKNELDVLVNLNSLNLGISYFYGGSKYLTEQDDIYNQEIKMLIEYNLYDKWWVKSEVRRKLGKKAQNINKNIKLKKWIENNIGLQYKGDCLNINLGIKRDYIRGKNLKPSITNYIAIEPIFN